MNAHTLHTIGCRCDGVVMATNINHILSMTTTPRQCVPILQLNLSHAKLLFSAKMSNCN